MKKPIRTLQRTAAAALAAAALLPSLAAAEPLQYTLSIYGYLPTIGGKTSFPADGGTNVNISTDQIIDSLKFTFMGALDVHDGKWGGFTDVIYLDVGGDKSRTRDFSIGNIGLPASTTADLNLDLKALVWTLAGEYRFASDPDLKMDLLAGARMVRLKQRLDYSITGDLGPIAPSGRSGSVEADESVWDAIVGVKGRYLLGDARKWSVPFYVDAGTGQSKSTWQAAAGIGYAFQWGELTAMWRYLDYKFESDKKVTSLNLNGPMIGANFRW